MSDLPDPEHLSAGLLLANKELVFQNEEKEKRAAEFIVANVELAFQNEEKGKCARELIINNRGNLERKPRIQQRRIKGSIGAGFMGCDCNILDVVLFLLWYKKSPDCHPC